MCREGTASTEFRDVSLELDANVLLLEQLTPATQG